ncbi:MAG: TRAP transporter permease, partial [Angelakisella sp.]
MSKEIRAENDTPETTINVADFDREASFHTHTGLMAKFVTALLLIFCTFQLGTTILGTLPPQLQRMTHLGFVVVLAYLLYPARKKDRGRNTTSILDMLLAAAFCGCVLYYILNYRELVGRSGAYSTLDALVAVVGVILVMEACRRVVGLPIVIIALVFLVYAVAGAYMPGFLSHRGYSIKRVATYLFYTTEGIIGLPLGVCATFIFLFILFGGILEKTGIGQFFIDICNSLAGFAPGGPAKVAVITSALEGTVSGSSVSNTVGSGAFTIPLMKSLGYKPEFAAAVEAAASTGGQIMPPIMGAAAFLMAEAVGIPYMEVAKAAAIPALLYFTGIWMSVHFEAKKLGLKGIPRDQLPKAWPLIKAKWHLITPLFIIVFMLTVRTASFAALCGIVAAVVIPNLRKSTRVKPSALFEAFISGTRGVIGVACACGVAGIIVGVVTLTGLGQTMMEGLLSFAGGNMLVTLFFIMIISLVLGMGVPTTANYLITSTIAAPVVMQLGVPALAAHLFTFYFGILADITPPVALA